MFRMKSAPNPKRSDVSRVVAGAVLALWCALVLASGDARTICLDLGGGCSPSAAVPESPCHDQAPDSEASPSCGSCVDIVVPEAASIASSRPEHGLGAPAAARSTGATDLVAGVIGHPAAALPRSPAGSPGRHPSQRTTVLRI